MSLSNEYKCFVGGLSWNIHDRSLEDTFTKFGKILEAQVMVDRDTGHSRGFGFVTFADRESLDEAIDQMHNKELDGRVISVTVAKPKAEGDGGDRGYGDGNNYGRERGTDCYKCGKPGHWARDCYSSSRDRYSGSRESRRFESERDRDHYSSRSGRSRRNDYDDHYPRRRDRYDREDRDYRDEDTRHGSDRNGGGHYRSRPGPYDRSGDRKERRSSYDRP